MKTISTEEVRELQRHAIKEKRFPNRSRWHEGTEFYGYWPERDSYVFRGDGHYLCVSRWYIAQLKGIEHDALAR